MPFLPAPLVYGRFSALLHSHSNHTIFLLFNIFFYKTASYDLHCFMCDFQGESESGKAPWQGVCIYLSWMSSLLTKQVIDIHLLSIS